MQIVLHSYKLSTITFFFFGQSIYDHMNITFNYKLIVYVI